VPPRAWTPKVPLDWPMGGASSGQRESSLSTTWAGALIHNYL
jgi:hypothetical protein